MKKTISFVLVCLLTCIILVACGPSQAELYAQATKVAADIFATQTAEAMVATPAPTDTPVPLARPTSTALTEELPTETRVPTHTPYPTYTPPPALTATTVPTDTPIPPTDTPLLPTYTPIPTDTPIPPTDTPVPTATPSPTPTVCPILPQGGFRTIWQSEPDLQTALGCPTSYHPRITPAAWQVQTSHQPFEHGETIWSDHIGWYAQPVVYVLYANSTYQRFDDTFDPVVDPISGGEMPPHGLVEPILGFGKVWREVPGLREALGWATADETPGLGRFQMFTIGNMVWISQTDKTYVLIGGIVHVFDVPFSESGWQVYANPSAGFTFQYPEGWMIEQEYYYETLGGEKAEYPTVVLRQIRNENPNDVIAINQRQFQCAEGECAEIGSILIGTYSDNPEILSVFDDIVASFEVH